MVLYTQKKRIFVIKVSTMLELGSTVASKNATFMFKPLKKYHQRSEVSFMRVSGLTLNERRGDRTPICTCADVTGSDRLTSAARGAHVTVRYRPLTLLILGCRPETASRRRRLRMRVCSVIQCRAGHASSAHCGIPVSHARLYLQGEVSNMLFFRSPLHWHTPILLLFPLKLLASQTIRKSIESDYPAPD